ncbi:hypothetical protein BXO88_08705 [Oribacterium sp. C9]|uniref:C39 family peptidase n=1 Tax=Oribacterium sp. C9 TaxID=1943579 RepID=UPI00098F5389|nr:C39 family peptidase [Oribacterium sp. C9]OON86121.1 hypothetical protein BXO88_08705 [Oribacterium sp. C9]
MDYHTSASRKKAWDGINYDRRDAYVPDSYTAGGYATSKTFKEQLSSWRRTRMEISDSISDDLADIRSYFAEQKAENRYMREHLTKEEVLIGFLIRVGIFIAAIILSISIAYLIRPFTPQDVYDTGQNAATTAYTTLHMPVDAYTEYRARKAAVEAAKIALIVQRHSDTKANTLLDWHDTTSEAPDLSKLYSEKPVDIISGVPLPDILHYVYNDYNQIISTAMGSMLYFSQGDSHWKEYRIAGADRMGGYGCGPVTVAMLANSFSNSDTPVTPIDVADWAVENKEYAVHGGSYHSLIPNALKHYGLICTSVEERTPEKVHELLSTGHVLVALMGKGSLTDVGHFVIITENAPDGGVMIADPAKLSNSEKSWPAELLVKELKAAYDAGGPLWAVSY